MQMSGQFDALATSTLRTEPRYPLDKRLGGSQNRSGRGSEETNSVPAGDWISVVQLVA
jgi:hypothetical protein